MKKNVPAGVRVASIICWALGLMTLLLFMLIGGIGSLHTTILEDVWSVIWASSVLFLVSGYGLWQSRKWAAILALILVVLSFPLYIQGVLSLLGLLSLGAALKQIMWPLLARIVLGVIIISQWKHFK